MPTSTTFPSMGRATRFGRAETIRRMSLTPPTTSLSTYFVYGPPGSGKSSVGRLLAQALDLPFWDLDAEIEARARKSIPAIFDKFGEAGFRKRERKVLEALLAHPRGVLSLGGGALLDEQNRARVEAHGPVVCLEASVDTLLSRLGAAGQERPLLAGDVQAQLENLLAARREPLHGFSLQDTNGRPLQFRDRMGSSGATGRISRARHGRRL